MAAAAARPRRLGRFKCHLSPGPWWPRQQPGPCRPDDSEGSSVTRTIVQPVARARASRRRLQHGHNLGRPGRAWATGSEPLSPIFRVTDQAALNAALRQATQAGRRPSGWQLGPYTFLLVKTKNPNGADKDRGALLNCLKNLNLLTAQEPVELLPMHESIAAARAGLSV